MSKLPSVDIPKFTIEIPSTKEKITFKPFLVKEEKILTLAMHDGKEETILQALSDIIESCSFGKVNASTITSFDFEYIYLKIHTKSKGSAVDVEYTCKNKVDDVECGHKTKFIIDLDKVRVESNDPNHTKKVMITDTMGIMFKYPSIMDISKIKKSIVENPDNMFSLIKNYIECIFEGDTIYDDFNEDEFDAWLENLNKKQFQKIENFFQNIPTIVYEDVVVCGKCGHKETVRLEGLRSFLE